MSSVSSSSKDERRSVVTKDIIRGEQLTDWSLASKLSDMEPFLSRPVVERLKRSLPSSPIINVDEINEIKQPPSIKIATLRDYQLRGVSWIVDRYDKGINCILADEMGLGKTLQTIAFFAHLKDVRNLCGPHLVVVPLSVLFNWMSECKKFCPSLRVMRLHTNSAAEKTLQSQKISRCDEYDVCITTYEMVKTPGTQSSLSRMHWRSIVLDEGHRIKNTETNITKACNLLKSRFKIVLTGTPIQNNLGEMYCLLHYLAPKIFDVKEVFDDCFSLISANIVVNRNTLANAHYMLRTFILRRLKTEVELSLPTKLETLVRCPMSDMQKFWTKQLLQRDGDLMSRVGGGVGDYKVRGEDWRKLQSLLAQLRKAANHPYLFPGAETDPNPDATEEIVTASGKMVMLDRLLCKLKEKGHRVVIFSQYTRTLDIINDYLDYRGYSHVRLDGSTNRVFREVLITQFNMPSSETFIFCLSTRAGGEGVNLYTADTVILFDSDWNPQVDIQAMARVHRIGQTKPVHIYRLVSAGTVEERIVQRAQKKLFLDSMVNRGSTAKAMALDEEHGRGDGNPEDDNMDNSTVLSALKFGWNSCFGGSGDESLKVTDSDLEAILDRTRGHALPTKSNNIAPKNESPSKENRPRKCPLGNLREGQECTAADFEETAPLISLRIFEGEAFTKSKRAARSGDISQEWMMESKRVKVSRLVEEHVVGVGKVSVLKSNMYTLEEGEPSVFEKETRSAKNDAEAKGETTYKRKIQRAGVDYEHQDFCQICWEGGDLLCCDHCPGSYHIACLGLDKLPGNLWTCPQHKSCVECGKSSSAVGFLFRCSMCANAHCEDCRSGEQEIIGERSDWADAGFRVTGNCCYVMCSKSCSDFAQAQKEAARKFKLVDLTASSQ